MAEPMIHSDDEHSSSDVDLILAESTAEPQETSQKNTRITRKDLKHKKDSENDKKNDAVPIQPKQKSEKGSKKKEVGKRKSRSSTKKGPKAKGNDENQKPKVNDETDNLKASPRKRKKSQKVEVNTSSTKRPNRRASLRKKMSLNTTSCSVDTNELVETATGALKSCRIVHDLEPCTHLIMENPSRTLKTLFAIARGAWILSPAWVLTSLEKGGWVDEEPFETKAFKGASRSRKCAGNEEKGILGTRHQLVKLLKLAKNLQDEPVRIYVAPNCEPEPRVLKQLIGAAGGEVVDNFSTSDVCICPKTFSTKTSTPPRVKPEWLFDSLASYELQQPSSYSWK